MTRMRRSLWATCFGLVLSLAFARSAAAICIVQPIDRLVKGSDDVIDATAAPERSPGIWELTVHLDQVLKGEGSPGDTYFVYTSTCGLFLSRHAAEKEAQGFVGDQRLFLVHMDHRGRYVAYSEIVQVSGAPSGEATAEEQYAAALADLGLTREAVSPSRTGAPPVAAEGSSPPLLPWVLVAAVVVGVAAWIARRRRTNAP
jgi:hypothetical protein